MIEPRFRWLTDWEEQLRRSGLSDINQERFHTVINLVTASEARDFLLNRFLCNLYHSQAEDINGWTSKALRQLVLETWDDALNHEFLPDIFYDPGRHRRPVADERRQLRIWLSGRRQPPQSWKESSD